MVRTKVLVISLDDAHTRRARVRESLQGPELDWSFFDAQRALHPELTYRPEMSHPTHGRTLRAGELGCYSSHYAAWRWLLESDYDQLIVLEDDVGADWNLLAHFARTPFAELGIHYLRMFAKIPPRWRYVASPFFDRYHHLIRCTGYALGTQAYLVTKTGAATFAQAGRAVHYPVDAFMDRYWQHGMPNLAIFPFPVFEHFAPSSIGAARFETETIAPAARWQYRVQRIATRLRMLREYIGPERASIRVLKHRLRGRFDERFAVAAPAR